jgi:YD repeat-containing protein
MKKNLLFLALFIYYTANSQYYYNDILSTQQTNTQYKLLRSNTIKSIKAFSYEDETTLTENFLLEVAFNKLGREMVTTTSANGINTLLTSSYQNNRVIKSVQNAARVENTITYLYDATGKIQSLTTSTIDTFMKSNLTEQHLWQYNANNQPSLMLRIKNGSDTTKIEFVYDEFGNVGEEHWKRNGRTTESYYYYYNDKKLLTDIVRYNSRAKKMLPDFMFEYDDKGRVNQMIQVTTGSSSYVTFKYSYNEKGLKQSETVFNKLKQQVGHIEYAYATE